MGGNDLRALPDLLSEAPPAAILGGERAPTGPAATRRRPGTGEKRARWRATPPEAPGSGRRTKRRAAPDRTERLQTQVPGPARGDRRGAGTTAATQVASMHVAAAVRDGSGSPPRSERRE